MWIHLHTGSYLAGTAGFPLFPVTVSSTAASKRWTATKQNVQDHPEAPKITALIAEWGFICKYFHHLWNHVLSWSTLKRRDKEKSFLKCRLSTTWLIFMLNDKKKMLKVCVYRCSKFRSSYGGTGTVQLHTTSQVKITDLHRRHLQKHRYHYHSPSVESNPEVLKTVITMILSRTFTGPCPSTGPHHCNFPTFCSVTTWNEQLEL